MKKEFNLSEKRKEYLNLIRELIRNKETNDLVKSIFGAIEEQDKEFIKETIEDLNDFRLGRDMVIFRFEKRVGDDLK